MNPRHTHSVIGPVRAVAVVTAVVVAGALAGVVGVGALVADGSSTSTLPVNYRDQRAIVEYARANGLTGLSPASLDKARPASAD